MDADFWAHDYGENWSNWICPSCHAWHDLDDWVPVSAPEARSAAGRMP